MVRASIEVLAVIKQAKTDKVRIQVMMMQPKFKNKDGSLTAYAFSCGYIELSTDAGVKLGDCKKSVNLWKDCAWHVRGNDFEAGVRLFWESFDKLTDALKFYKSKVRE